MTWTRLSEYLRHVERRGASQNVASFIGLIYPPGSYAGTVTCQIAVPRELLNYGAPQD